MTDPAHRLTAALADRYRIERELGQGGMATVYLAHDVRHDRKVALKVLRPELSAILGADRFLAEIKTTANLQHPHILSLFDSGEADGLVFYVMPYVEGESLRDRLRREKQLPVDEAVRIAREVADALQYAHEHGIVHRDIKPENILLHGGHALVADFGIALAASRSEGGTRMTETGLSLGTPHYMSPEQAMGEREITPRTDVYAVGCVLYEMLTGEPPFTGPTAQAVVARVMTEEPRSLTLQRHTIPPNVEAAVTTALAKLPADRFESASAFAAALANPGYTLATTALTTQVRPAARRWLTSAALVVTALAAGMLLGRRGGEVGSVGPSDVVRVALALGDSALIPPVANLRLAISPDGKRVAYVGADGADRALWVRDLDDPPARLLRDTKNAVAPFFSPDGESIGFFSDAGGHMQLKVVGVGGGVVNTIVDDSVARFGGGDWCEDGRIYFTTASRGLARVSALGGAVTPISRPDPSKNEIEHDYPDVLPGCRRAVIMIWGGSPAANRIGLVDLASGAATVLADGSFPRYVAPGYLVIGMSDGRVLASPFDARRGRMTGAPVLMLQDAAAEQDNATVQFAVSATGTLVFQPTDGSRTDLVWVDRDGRRTPVDTALKEVGAAALSPDGSRIAFSRGVAEGNEVWVRHLATGAAFRLSTGLAGAGRPAWTPDGRQVAFLATGDGVRTAWLRRADGSDSARAVAPGVRLDEIAFDRLGRYTLLRSEGTVGTRHLLVMERGRDTIPRTLVQSGFDNFAMTLSPNGRWLAYASTESGAPQINVRPFPAVDSARYVISAGGGSEPLWSHDGRELFFRSPRGEMFAVPVATAGPFTSGVPKLLFDGVGLGVDRFHRSYDVTADGRRFLMTSFGGADGTSLSLVLNWRAELERALRTAR